MKKPKDTVRLDWLEHDCFSVIIHATRESPYGLIPSDNTGRRKLRELCDRAMAAERRRE